MYIVVFGAKIPEHHLTLIAPRLWQEESLRQCGGVLRGHQGERTEGGGTHAGRNQDKNQGPGGLGIWHDLMYIFQTIYMYI